MPPDLVVVGHITEDRTPSGPRPGGTVWYGARAATRLGLRVAVVTRAAPSYDLAAALPGTEIVRAESAATTTIEHRLHGRRRTQVLHARADALRLDAIPDSLCRTRLLLLAPVIDEVDPAVLAAFPDALVGATVQGWLRRAGDGGRIEAGHIEGLNVAALAGRVRFLSLSDDDLAGAAVPPAWEAAFPIVAVTLGRRGLRLFHRARWFALPAFPATERDPTGAGDAFATAFLIRYAETDDVEEAARFGAATASFVVEAPGVRALSGRDAVERRLAAHPEVRLTPLG